MQRAIDCIGQALIGGDSQEDVAGFHRDLVFVEVVVLQQLDVIHRAFDQRFGAGLAVFFQQIAFKTSGIDPDADRAAIRFRCPHDFGDPFAAADVAGIDAEAGGTGIGSFQRALVVEMDIGDQRHPRRLHDLPESRGAFLIGAGDPDDIGTRFLASADLVDGRAGIGGWRVRHRLHGNGRIAADRCVADHDPAALAAFDRAPGADGIHVRGPFAGSVGQDVCGSCVLAL